MQDEDRALVEVEPRKAPVELVALGDRELVAHVARYHVPDHLQLDEGPPPLPSGLPIAGSNEEAMEPRPEPLGVAQAPDVPPCLDQGILGRVFRSISIAEDQ